MNRRHFIAASGAAATLPFASLANHSNPRQFLEVIIYHLHPGLRRGLVADFYRDVALPTYRRLGIGPVGTFSVMHGPTAPSLFVVVPHDTLESAANAASTLRQDATYLQEGEAFLGAPLSDPAYVRHERLLLHAFTDMPTVEPQAEALGSERIFEWRRYESHSRRAGQKKIAMFNEGGEIAIFRRVGLIPVFFGDMLFGASMPNLTYLLAFENMAEREAAWQRFLDDPEWHALRDDPQYADTVSNIASYLLAPTSFSEI